MRKVFCLCFIVITVLMCPLVCFAYTQADSNISLQYVGTRKHVESFALKDGGRAHIRVYLKPNTKETFDEVKMDIKVTDEKNNSVHGESLICQYEPLEHSFLVEKDIKLESKGTYKMKVTYKCYQNKKLIETINSPIKNLTY